MINENKNQMIYNIFFNKDMPLVANDTNMHLTKREIEVLRYIITGSTAKKIGKLLNISNRTVECYINNLKRKLLCQTKAEIIFIALSNNIINKYFKLD